MSIADKLVTIAENEQKVYEAGKKSMVDASKIIEATATGESILLLDDVSEIPHEVDVRVWSKNLLDINSTPASVRNVTYNINGSTITVVPTGASLPRLVYEINVKKNTTYYVSGNFEMANHEDYNGISQIGIRTGAGSGSFLAVGNYFNGSDSSTQKVKLSFNSGDYETVYFWFYYDIVSSTNGYGNSYAIYSDFQIEEGTEATPYVPYVDVSGTSVAVYGRNILDIDKGLNECLVKNEDGSYTFAKTANNRFSASIPFEYPYVDVSMYTEIIDTNIENCDSVIFILYNADKTKTHTVAMRENGNVYGTLKDSKTAQIFVNGDLAVGSYITFKNPQFVISKTPITTYEPFNSSVLTLDEEGKAKTKSISPYMTFVPSVSGAQITAVYHKSWGMQTEYDRFWDTYQDKGNRIFYANAFTYDWNDKTFKPKYNIVFGGDYTQNAADNMFYKTKIADLVGCLKKQGVTIDFTNCTRLSSTFDRSDYLTTIPHINAINCTLLSLTFFNLRKVKSIEISNIKETCSFDRVFNGLSSLEELKLNNCVIGQNGVNLQNSVLLSRESITSIINALSTSTSGLTVTLSKTAVNNAFTTDEWNTLIATRNNWTISLV